MYRNNPDWIAAHKSYVAHDETETAEGQLMRRLAAIETMRAIEQKEESA